MIPTWAAGALVMACEHKRKKGAPEPQTMIPHLSNPARR